MQENPEEHDLCQQVLRDLLQGQDESTLVLTPNNRVNSESPKESDAGTSGLFESSVQHRTLPPIDEDYPENVRQIVREERPKQTYVLPAIRPPHCLPGSLENSLSDQHRDGDLGAITLLAVLEELGEGDRAAFTLPLDFFVRHSERSHRALSQDLARPFFVIKHSKVPAVEEKVWQEVQTIFYEKGKSENTSQVTRFFSIPKESAGTDAYDDFQHLVQRGGGSTELGYVVREEMDARYPWTFEARHPRVVEKISDLESLGPVKPIRELFDILGKEQPTPHLHSSEEPEASTQGGEEGTPLLRAMDIPPDGRDIERELLPPVPETSGQEFVELQPNDICIRAQVQKSRWVVACEVDPQMTPVMAGRDVLVLRPKTDLSAMDRLVALQFLQSDIAEEIVRARSLKRSLITADEIRDLPVPLSDKDLRTALLSLTQAADRFERWRKDALESARSLFDFQSVEDGKMHVLSTGRRTRQRQLAAERQDDLSYRIQTQFPHPIAYRWRTVAAAKPNLEGYLQVLECAEVLTCYLALIAITMAREVGEEIGYLEQMGHRIAEGRGTNLGDWIAILREVRESRSFRKLSDDLHFYEVMQFMPEKSDADQALASLKDRRDKQAHGKGPRGDAVAPAFEEAKNDLVSLLSATEFLSEYPLRYVDRTQADTIQDRLTYWYRDIMGDHPLVPVEKETTAPKTLEAGSLYLVDRSGSLHLLRPLLDRRRCPVCGTWSTFFLDSYLNGEDACVLKSMEHPHTTKDKEIYEAFQKIGILP